MPTDLFLFNSVDIYTNTLETVVFEFLVNTHLDFNVF